MDTSIKLLPVNSVDFDHDNPRIKLSLEKYGLNVNDARVKFALRSAMDESSPGNSSFLALKQSIRAAKGISIPITVYERKGKFICVDGNTRLLIYHQLAEEGVAGNWSEIKAQILNKPDRTQIETARITAHLVGARQWPAYEKARFLHELHYDQFMDPDQLVTLCGGNKRQIQQQIDAFHDMNKYYRDPNPDEAFHIDRFSGFVELQKPGIKEAIFENGLELEDFGNWIRDGNIRALADVRLLPRVLADEEARKLFVEGGPDSIKYANQFLISKLPGPGIDKPVPKTRVSDAAINVLAIALLDKIEKLPRTEFLELRAKSSPSARETIDSLVALVDPLKRLLEDVGE